MLNVGETIIPPISSSRVLAIFEDYCFNGSLQNLFGNDFPLSFHLSACFFAPVSRYEIHVACYDRKVNVPRICLLFLLFILARVLGSLRVSKRIPSLRRGICKWTTQFLGWRPFAIFCQSIDIIEFLLFSAAKISRVRAYLFSKLDKSSFGNIFGRFWNGFGEFIGIYRNSKYLF